MGTPVIVKYKLSDLGIKVKGTWTSDGMPQCWYIDGSNTDNLPSYLRDQGVLTITEKGVYVRGLFSPRLTCERELAMSRSK